MTKNLKHVQLFESFIGNRNSYIGGKKGFVGPIEIGFYGEGGYGSHPAIIDRAGAEALSKYDQGPYATTTFHPVISLNSLPYAFMYILDFYVDEKPEAEQFTSWGGYSPWKFYPLSQSEYKALGGDGSYYIRTEPDAYVSRMSVDINDPRIQKMLSFAGYEPGKMRGEVSFDIGIIDGRQVNTVYWSDYPEESQGALWGDPVAKDLFSLLSGEEDNY